MCGVAGVIGRVHPSVVDGLVREMHHRGPDGDGFAAQHGIRLGSCRLSIVDVNGGDQPFYSEDGQISAVVNGEIYNYEELRAELLGRGHVLRSASDAEVVVHLYEDYRERCVEKLRGMFAFAVASRDGLLLARDRLGIKPLYMYRLPDGSGLAFASEQRALLRSGVVDKALDEVALAESFVIGYPLESRTLFRGVHELPPGETMFVSLRNGELVTQSRRYYERPTAGDRQMTFREAAAVLREKLEETVESHFIGEYPMAVTLSGGLDSTVLAAAAAARHNDLTAFTVADRDDHPDVLVARQIAEHLEIPYRFVRMNYDEAFAAIPAFVAAFETMPSLAALPSYLLSKEVAKKTKICLDGEGADELFGGYIHHMNTGRIARAFDASLAACRSAGLIASDALLAAIDVYRADSQRGGDAAAVLGFEQRDQLVRQHFDPLDKLGMACSLEYRVPYVDHELFELGNALPVEYRANRSLGIGKHVLRAVALDMLGAAGLDAVLRAKHGFPSSGAGFAHQFNVAADGFMPAEYKAKHELGTCFPSTGKLLLFDLFLETFLMSDGTSEIVMSEFIGERSTRPAAALPEALPA